MAEPALTKKEAYILKLHELLWEFIELHDRDDYRTGDVVACAEQALLDMRQRWVGNSLSGPSEVAESALE